MSYVSTLNFIYSYTLHICVRFYKNVLIFYIKYCRIYIFPLKWRRQNFDRAHNLTYWFFSSRLSTYSQQQAANSRFFSNQQHQAYTFSTRPCTAWLIVSFVSNASYVVSVVLTRRRRRRRCHRRGHCHLCDLVQFTIVGVWW